MAGKTAGREAAYRVVARDLRTAILSGRHSSGERLPTDAELCERYAVSRQTVRRAFQELVTEGMVRRVPGRGTFKAEPEGPYLRHFGSIDDLMSLSLDTVLEVAEPLRRRVDIAAAGQMRLETDVVWSLVFRRLHGSTPFCLTTVSLPPRLGSRLQDVPEISAAGATSTVTVIDILEKQLGIPVLDAEQTITAVAAEPDTAARLGCRPGEPLLRVDRLYRSTDSTPVEHSLSYFLPEQYTYRIRLRRSA